MAYKFVNIIEGNFNYLVGINKSISDERIDRACSRCVMSHEDQKYTGTCSLSKGGCGCSIGPKTSVSNESCPLHTWGNNWIKPERVDVINKEHEFVKK